MSLPIPNHFIHTTWFCLRVVAVGLLMSAAPIPQQPAPPPQPQQPTLADLAAARYQVATQGYQFAMAGHLPTDAPGADVLDWMRRRVRARLDIPAPKNDRVAFVKQYVEMLKAQEAFEEKMVQKRLSGTETLLRAQYDRIEGEMLLMQEQAK
ncbi:MAG TPA: hypothetical protein VFE47_27595 [Tepidisphaeraceae bacterium]|jgi:hypothetical protein|nr:hypothetical protein [Tepidisphaeraceae bacterium]